MAREWKDFANLLKKYGKKKHPLEYANAYQLLVAVILSARDSDRHINQISPRLFERFADMAALCRATPADLLEIMGKVSNSGNKSRWLCDLAGKIQSDENIPKDMVGLTALPGIGRKSANVIMGELGYRMEGVMVDLHVLRVAPRIGLCTGKTPEKVEKELMAFFPQKHWKEAGMALTHLGREVCRPRPKCAECIISAHCEYFQSL
ncbi:MAG: endonuclease III [Spirochaetales bacterium]|nr:endonuclease III [Spirochaetales bacterium]